jgi:hypothetical protein
MAVKVLLVVWRYVCLCMLVLRFRQPSVTKKHSEQGFSLNHHLHLNIHLDLVHYYACQSILVSTIRAI